MFVFIRDASFNTSHWIFAFEYFMLQKTMPYVLKGEEVPTEDKMFDKAIFYTMLSINILVPLFEGVGVYLVSEAVYH